MKKLLLLLFITGCINNTNEKKAETQKPEAESTMPVGIVQLKLDDVNFDYKGWDTAYSNTFSFQYPGNIQYKTEEALGVTIFSLYKKKTTAFPDFDMAEFTAYDFTMDECLGEVTQLIRQRYSYDANIKNNKKIKISGLDARYMELEITKTGKSDYYEKAIYANAYVLQRNGLGYIFITYMPDDDLKGMKNVFNYMVNSVRIK